MMMAVSQPADQPASGLRVLVVEDEALVAMLLEDMLAELGHEVVGPVAHLAKALEIARREQIDIAILDVSLNGGNTYSVAEALGARGIPFVFATGYGRAALPEPYADAPLLQKPFRQSELQDIFIHARKAHA